MLWKQAKVRDTFRAADLGTFARSFTAAVPLHGIVLVRISPLRCLRFLMLIFFPPLQASRFTRIAHKARRRLP